MKIVGGVGTQLQVEPMEEEERERTNPTVTFDCGFLTQENADTFPMLICRNSRQSETGATSSERKDPTSYLISFLVDCRTLLQDENEPSMKVFQEGSGGCERNEKTMQISQKYVEKNSSVRIEDDIPLLIGCLISQCNS